jgi:cytoplasmic iron level regulating protein YaaA (DUF328/UPF0246 family)
MPPKSAPLAILLPPSEGKAQAGTGPGWTPGDGVFGAELAPQRLAVVEALARLCGGDERLLGVGGAHLARAQSSNSSLLGSGSMPAAQRYTGVVWEHLGLSSLTPAVRRRAGDSIVVISGLLGVVGINDPTPDYRLKIGASPAPLGKMSTWWREPLSMVLNDHLEGRFVVDLLPNEHRAAWTPEPHRYADGVSVIFVERSGKVAGHDAKAAKGRFARHLLVSGRNTRAALASWRDDRFDAVLVPLHRTR